VTDIGKNPIFGSHITLIHQNNDNNNNKKPSSNASNSNNSTLTMNFGNITQNQNDKEVISIDFLKNATKPSQIVVQEDVQIEFFRIEGSKAVCLIFFYSVFFLI